MKWTWLRNPDNGVLQLPFGAGRHAPIAGADQAAVIAAILQSPQPHDGQIYPLYGAEELDHYGIAEQISAALDIPVRYEPIDIDTYDAAQIAKGRTEFFVQHVSNVARDDQNGIFAGENNLVEVISGHNPLTVGQYVQANRADFEHDGPFALRDQLPQKS